MEDHRGPVTDDALDAVADRYRSALRRVAPTGELCEFPITGYDRTGVPTASATSEDESGRAHGIGYGATDAAARVGALGELAERVLLDPVVRALPRRHASYAELAHELGTGHVCDPVTLVLAAGSGYDRHRPGVWVPTTRWRTGEQVWVPVELVASNGGQLPAPPPEGWLTTPISNGLGAGDSADRAVGHALLELVQRDHDTVDFRALDTGVVADLSASIDPGTRAVLTRLHEAGVHPVMKLAGTELACVVHCAARDEDPATPPIALSAIGEAAHPDRDVAVRKALLELASSRARRAFVFGPLAEVHRRNPGYLLRELARPLPEQEPRALAAMTAWTHLGAAELGALLAPHLLRVERTVALDTLPSADPGTWTEPAALLVTMLDRLAAFDVLVVLGGDEDGVRAAKVLAPGFGTSGLEVETLSYLRIGERVARRLLERGSPLVGRTARDGLPVHLTAAAVERLDGPVWLDADAVHRTVGELYPLYREPGRHAVQRSEAGR